MYGPLKNVLGMTRVRVAYTGGEAIGPDLFDFYRSLGINLKQLYGMTETCVTVCMQRSGDVKLDTVGRPMEGVEVKIADSGEVMVRSPGLMVAYYSVMEKMGKPKREILVERVTETRKAQEEAKAQFRDALTQFFAVTKVDGGDLQAKYEQMSDELKASEAKAKAVHDRIAALDNVATALFSEWRKELGQYTSDALRRQSEDQYKATVERYQRLTAAMQKATARMDPVLATFRDQVLFLKHNLNARAVAGLSGTARELERDIAKLVAEMERSITEADAFIRNMQGQG